MSLFRAARLAVFAGLLVAAAWSLWPAPLGGSTTYLVTSGTSMQPGIHAGDLVLLRTSDHYAVGDVVGYRSPSLGRTVLHRIVATDGAALVFRGDNNGWLDPDTATAEQVLGRLWVRLPDGGPLLAGLRSPVIVLLLGVALVAALARPTRRARGRHASNSSVRTGRGSTGAGRAALALAAVAVVAAVAEAALFAQPLTRATTTAVPVTHQGQFSYTAQAAPGATYPGGRVTTGDPVYTKLSRSVTVSFEDRIDAPAGAELDGVLTFAVSVATGDGWHALLPAGPVTRVQDGRASGAAVLDLVGAADLVHRHLTEVGLGAGDATVTVQPTVDVRGTVAGQPYAGRFAPTLPFALNATVLRLADAGRAATLTPTAQTQAQARSLTPAHVSLAGRSVPVGTLRWAVGAVLVLAVVGAAAAGLLRRRFRRDPVAHFLARTGDRTVPVHACTPGTAVVDLHDGEALARIAERLDALVLHLPGPDHDAFMVQDGSTTYRWAVPVWAEDDQPALLRVV